jgi:hypothetical protein
MRFFTSRTLPLLAFYHQVLVWIVSFPRHTVPVHTLPDASSHRERGRDRDRAADLAGLLVIALDLLPKAFNRGV